MDSIGKLDTVDTRLISTFTTLARTGSFTAAAAELHLAQSTVTAHIQTLERELRARLIDRLPSGAALTETGRRALERAQLLLDAEAALRAEAASDGPIEGEVTVGATESLCAYLLPGAIAALHASHPGVDVRLTPSGTAGTVERLRDGRISVGLILEPALRASDLVIRKAGALDLGFACAPDHTLAGRKAGWAELAKHRWFLLEEGCTYSDDVARELAAGEHPQITRLGSVEAVRACVAAGLGLSLLPAFALAGRGLAEFQAPRIRPNAILLARHARRSPSLAQQAVLDELAKAAALLN
ncbi:LysR family transcriptional regulator [Amycolatopsis sp. NPDC059657]|uniref:LysR family transcriptional regulator n=1 Tax=Amycolatopsis sp. NPDC059657 TaxID=3346899 RepID=UPI003671A7E5